MFDVLGGEAGIQIPVGGDVENGWGVAEQEVVSGIGFPVAVEADEGDIFFWKLCGRNVCQGVDVIPDQFF